MLRARNPRGRQHMSAGFDPRLDDPLPAVRKDELLVALQRVLPADSIIASPEALRVYECDGLSAYRALPMIAVLPVDEDQLRDTLRVCHAMGAPIVPRGAGTGLSGGALPLECGVLIVMSRMSRILEIDPCNRVARVQPGVRNLAVSEAARPYGLYFAPDPSSQIACSIGGNVAENAGGIHCLKYGITGNNLLALRVVTIEGEVLEVGGPGLDAPGFDLLALLTGSEGMLGIISEVSLELLPSPESVRVLLAAFGSIREAAATVADIIASGILPAGLEMMDRPAIHAAEDFVGAGYPRDAAAILLCELDGHPADVAADLERVTQIARDGGATEVRAAGDESEAAKFWSGRKNAFPAVGRVSPDYYCMDGTIPRRRLGEVLEGIAALSEQYDLEVANVFHAGDGNLHPLILYDATRAGELHKAEELGGRILELCVAAGGAITGEHGVGREKINQMCAQFNNAEIAQFQAIRDAFDPQRLLNPTKSIPTLARCAEFGAMHIHAGRLPHPDLERY